MSGELLEHVPGQVVSESDLAADGWVRGTPSPEIKAYLDRQGWAKEAVPDKKARTFLEDPDAKIDGAMMETVDWRVYWTRLEPREIRYYRRGPHTPLKVDLPSLVEAGEGFGVPVLVDPSAQGAVVLALDSIQGFDERTIGLTFRAVRMRENAAVTLVLVRSDVGRD